MAVINGTVGDDLLNGTDDADTIDGMSGNDTISGGLGADILRGGEGDDRFLFNAVRSSSEAFPNGSIDGGAGYDTIDLSGVAPAFYSAAPGGLTIRVGTQIFDVVNVERLILTAAKDYVFFIPDGIEVHGGLGNDTFQVQGNVRAFGDEGDDDFFLSGSFGGQPISGGIIDGGSGVDLLKTNILFTVDLEAGTAESGDTSYILRNFENVQVATVGGYSSTVFGDGGNNVFSINPLFANDDNGAVGVVFDGRGGNDTLLGSNGGDTLIGGDGNDYIDGRGGSDDIDGGAGDDIIVASPGSDYIDGGSGVDTLRFAGLTRSYSVALGAAQGMIAGGGENTATSFVNVENLVFRDGLITFDENGVAAQVYRMYDSAFGRAPDYFGGQGWIDALNAGLPLVRVADLFVGSPEFQGRIAGLSTGQLVDYIYNFTLHREPDPGGKANWVAYLDSGRSVAEMLVGFSESLEHKANTAEAVQTGLWDGNKTFEAVEFLYDAVFSRHPDEGGLLNWVSALEAGATVHDLATIFVDSPEYRANTLGKDHAQLVDYTYLTALDRAADPGGRANWIAYLDAGGSIADLVTQFATSAELMNNNIPYIDHGAVFI